MVKAAWFRHYTQDELPEQFDRIVQSWDTASKATELSPHPSLPRMRYGIHTISTESSMTCGIVSAHSSSPIPLDGPP